MHERASLRLDVEQASDSEISRRPALQGMLQEIALVSTLEHTWSDGR